jgi:hypothetical protein
MKLDQDQFRAAVITALASRNSAGLGRTAIMKLMYFLQVLKKVPLGYSYRLYTYGPYDDQVLEDLRLATDQEAVSAQAFQWQGGIGYKIKPGKNERQFIERAGKQLSDIDAQLDWVMLEFGNRSASDLEVISTVIYVDRAAAEEGEHLTEKQIVERVAEVKPHHTAQKIAAVVADLKAKNLINSI